MRRTLVLWRLLFNIMLQSSVFFAAALISNAVVSPEQDFSWRWYGLLALLLGVPSGAIVTLLRYRTGRRRGEPWTS